MKNHQRIQTPEQTQRGFTRLDGSGQGRVTRLRAQLGHVLVSEHGKAHVVADRNADLRGVHSFLLFAIILFFSHPFLDVFSRPRAVQRFLHLE